MHFTAFVSPSQTVTVSVSVSVSVTVYVFVSPQCLCVSVCVCGLLYLFESFLNFATDFVAYEIKIRNWFGLSLTNKPQAFMNAQHMSAWLCVWVRLYVCVWELSCL